MSRDRFRLQAALVIGLIVLVSWPQMRPLRATSVWRAGGPLEPQRDGAASDRRLAYGGDDQRAKIGWGSLGSDPDSDNDPNRTMRKLYDNGRGTNPRYVTAPPEAAALGARFNALFGRARTALNVPVPYARLVLRNLITGMIEARAVADQEGRFTFLDLVASGYIVELLGPDGDVVASSETVTLENGEMKQATVRVAASSTVQALYGNVVAPTVADPVRTAVESGVDRVTQPTFSVSDR